LKDLCEHGQEFWCRICGTLTKLIEREDVKAPQRDYSNSRPDAAQEYYDCLIKLRDELNKG